MEKDQATSENGSPLVERPPIYHSFLLRMWEERSGDPAEPVWRFSLEDPATNQRFGFPSLDALMVWLKARLVPQLES